jgi:hypothetical protein
MKQIIFEKLIVAQLAKNFPASHLTRMLVPVFTIARIQGAFVFFLFYVKNLLSPALPPNSSTAPCRLFAPGYLIYSQLPSISGGFVFQSQPEDEPCHGDNGPTNYDEKNITIYYTAFNPAGPVGDSTYKGKWRKGEDASSLFQRCAYCIRNISLCYVYALNAATELNLMFCY